MHEENKKSNENSNERLILFTNQVCYNDAYIIDFTGYPLDKKER